RALRFRRLGNVVKLCGIGDAGRKRDGAQEHALSGTEFVGRSNASLPRPLTLKRRKSSPKAAARSAVRRNRLWCDILAYNKVPSFKWDGFSVAAKNLRGSAPCHARFTAPRIPPRSTAANS